MYTAVAMTSYLAAWMITGLMLYVISGGFLYACLPRLSRRVPLRPSLLLPRAAIALGPFAWPAWRERWSRAVTPEDPYNDWKRLVVRWLAWSATIMIGLAAVWLVVVLAELVHPRYGPGWSEDDKDLFFGNALVVPTMLAVPLVIIPGALVLVNVLAILIRRDRPSPR